MTRPCSVITVISVIFMFQEYNEARSSFNDCRSKRRNAESKSKDLRERYEPLIKRVKEKVAIVKSFQTKEEVRIHCVINHACNLRMFCVP